MGRPGLCDIIVCRTNYSTFNLTECRYRKQQFKAILKTLFINWMKYYHRLIWLIKIILHIQQSCRTHSCKDLSICVNTSIHFALQKSWKNVGGTWISPDWILLGKGNGFLCSTLPLFVEVVLKRGIKFTWDLIHLEKRRYSVWEMFWVQLTIKMIVCLPHPVLYTLDVSILGF